MEELGNKIEFDVLSKQPSREIDLKQFKDFLQNLDDNTDRTGLKLWDCEILLSKYILLNFKKFREGDNFIEISGGFAGILIQSLIIALKKTQSNEFLSKKFYITEGNKTCLKTLK